MFPYCLPLLNSNKNAVFLSIDFWKLSEVILVFEFSCFYCWAVKSMLLLCSHHWGWCSDFSIQVSVVGFHIIKTCSLFSLNWCWLSCWRTWIISLLFPSLTVFQLLFDHKKTFRGPKQIFSGSYSVKSCSSNIFNNSLFFKNDLAEWTKINKKVRSETSSPIICSRW